MAIDRRTPKGRHHRRRPRRRQGPRRRPAPMVAAGVAVVALLAGAGCGPTAGAGGVGAAGVPSAGVPSTGVPAAADTTGPCHVRGIGSLALPDPGCTPGATNPAVTGSDIAATICRAGWAASVRPPESYTEPLKIRQMARYGESGLRGYEEDHLIPLELGGSPTDPANLWPEPGAAPNPKDEVEWAANRAVCDGTLGLAESQEAMATDWVALGRRLGVASADPGRPAGRPGS